MAKLVRGMHIKTPLGDPSFVLESLKGSELVSEPFRFELTLLTEPGIEVEFDKLLGQKVTITFELPEEKKRYLHGIVTRLTQGPEVRGDNDDKARIRFVAELAPEFSLLSRTLRSRIFQQKTVPDILKEVLKGLDVAWETKVTYEPRDYCAQYRESDFHFASRLMEEEGIYYYFKHTDSAHKMVVADKPEGHADVTGNVKVRFEDSGGGKYEEDLVHVFQKTQEVRAGKFTLWDHCFEMPDKNLEATAPVTPDAKVGAVTHKLKIGGNDKFEVYDYPGFYAHRFDGIAPGGAEQASKIQKIFDDNKRTVGIRMQQDASASIAVLGNSTCRQFSAGHKFTLDEHFNGNGSYVLLRVDHVANQIGRGGGGGMGGKFQYENRFQALPAALPFRPHRKTPKSRVEGVQTAVVVGPKDQEIFPDKYGRVKVQFFWDRDGKKDVNSSCWVRVATPWAGKNRGFIRIPRVGEEVIVAFLEGDPDQPIIVGCVYNFENMPPYVLPDNKTQSGLKTLSTLKGKVDQFNELRFEDKIDNEEIYFHAQKDFIRIVENNDSLQIGYEAADGEHKSDDGSQKIKIYKDRNTELETGNDILFVDKGNREITVKEGNQKLEVTKGTRDVVVKMTDTHHVKEGNIAVKVDKGHREVKIDTGNDALTVAKGDITVKASAGAILIQAAKSIELKVGGSSIKLEPDKITLKMSMSKIELSGKGVTVNGMKVDVKAMANLGLAGLESKLDGTAMVSVKGGICKIN